MEPCSIKNQKIQAMKTNKKRAKIVYNLVLYTLTSIITCFFFSFPFWFPSISTHSLFTSFLDKVSLCFNAKCFFVVGNLIILILVGESKLKQSSSSPDIYEEYVARSQRRLEKTLIVGEKTLIVERPKVKKERVELGMRSSKSEVWGESGMVKSEKIAKGKKREGEKEEMGIVLFEESVRVEKEGFTLKSSMKGEEKKMGMRSCRSAVWGESEKRKGKKEEKKMGMRSSKSEVWGESGMVKSEKITRGKKGEGEKEEMGIVLLEGESVEKERGRVEKEEFTQKNMKKMGMRSCRSETEIVRLGRMVAKEEEEQQLNMLNKRVEDFIARVNKQRLIV